MPTGTFFNLPEEKRDRLIQGAMKEFVAVPLYKASVSNIIINAQISRGSFYQYFEDINDLYYYLVGLFQHNTRKMLKQCLIKEKGDFVKGWALFGTDYICSILNSEKVGFYKNMYLHMNYKLNRKINAFLVSVEKTTSGITYQNILDEIDSTSLRIIDEKEIDGIMNFCLNMMNQTIIESFYMEWSIEETQKMFHMRLDWIANGVQNKQTEGLCQ